MRAAILHASSGKVQNVIELADDHDPAAEGAYTPPPGHRLEPDPDGRAQIGGHFADGEWHDPEPDPDVGAPDAQEAAALEADVVAPAEDALVAMLETLAGGGNLSNADKAAIPDLAVKALGGRAKLDRLRGRPRP